MILLFRKSIEYESFFKSSYFDWNVLLSLNPKCDKSVHVVCRGISLTIPINIQCIQDGADLCLSNTVAGNLDKLLTTHVKSPCKFWAFRIAGEISVILLFVSYMFERMVGG